ncbi:MAG: NAD(P)-dependent oxidoreductase [Chloroflexota bacterium]|nr:NAD(P)-dependent oxidoreductase [Chloroflexota bacterium]
MKSLDMPQTVAFVGLGAMGSGMARSLVRKEFTVRGYDLREEPREQLGLAGGQPCRSAADAGKGADIAVVIPLNADQVEQAIFGELGLAETLVRGSVVVCMSTMSPGRARELGARAAAAGLAWLDAPVSGGTVRAADGTLTTMVGGESADLDRARAAIEAFSSHVFHLGPVGAGSIAKMVNQILVFNNLVASVEAMMLCRKAGGDPQAVYDVICTAMGTSAVFESRVPRLIDGSYHTGGSLRIALKDLGIVEDTARELGLPMLMTAQSTQLYRATAAAGMLDQDDLAIARLMEQLAGL